MSEASVGHGRAVPPERSSLDRKGGPRRARPAPDPVARALALVARGWQLGPSRLLPPACRFHPSCSAYAIEAWTRYGALAGSRLAAKRLLRCHPWGGCGCDPVP